MLKKPHHLQNTDGPPTGPSWQLFYIKNITTSDHFFRHGKHVAQGEARFLVEGKTQK